MTAALNTAPLTSELRGLSGYPGDAYDRAADALETTSRALSEKEGELAKLTGRLSFALDEGTSWAVKAGLATRQRDEALAALKASEERGGRLSQELASARCPQDLVRPLEWVQPRQFEETSQADTPFGRWVVWEIGDGYMKAPEAHCGRRVGTNLEAAKAAAQADFASRVLSCLVSPGTNLADATKKDPGTEQREAGV